MIFMMVTIVTPFPCRNATTIHLGQMYWIHQPGWYLALSVWPGVHHSEIQRISEGTDKNHHKPQKTIIPSGK